MTLKIRPRSQISNELLRSPRQFGQNVAICSGDRVQTRLIHKISYTGDINVGQKSNNLPGFLYRVCIFHVALLNFEDTNLELLLFYETCAKCGGYV